jgi:hypothetical protein
MVTEFKKLQLKRIQTKNKQCLPRQVSQTKSSSIPTQSLYAHLKYFAHGIHPSLLWSSEKRPVQNTQSASCSSSSVESLARGAASSVSEYDRVSDGVGSRQTLLFRFFWRTKKSIRHKPSGFGFSGLLDFLLLICFKIFFVRWTCYFFCCSTTRNWI